MVHRSIGEVSHGAHGEAADPGRFAVASCARRVSIGRRVTASVSGLDRLDKQMTIGQMQGKFQLHIMSCCGHCVHEDAPDQVAAAIAQFLVRYQLTVPLEDFPRFAAATVAPVRPPMVRADSTVPAYRAGIRRRAEAG